MNNLGNIGITEEQIDLLNSAERFCREVSPIETVRGLLENEQGFDSKVWQEIGELGWLAISIPEAYDGVGLSLTEVVPVMEQMGRRLLNTPFFSTTVAAQALIAGGSETQKSDLLPQIAAGQAATLALMEDNADWNMDAIAATATGNGDGYGLSGKKVMVMDLDAAQNVIVSVKLDGQTRLAILSDIPASAMRREGVIDETKRAYELTLDGLSIEEDALLPAETTEATLKHIHLTASLLGAAELVGATQACIEYTVEYLKTRKQFGKLIGSYQSLKHPTVDAFIGYEQARSLLYAAAYSFKDQGTGEVATRMAKAAADDSLSFAADRAIQFHGGFGFTYDCDAQLYRRRAIFNASQYGNAAYHRAKLADLIL